jgi:hypothetical protein
MAIFMGIMRNHWIFLRGYACIATTMRGSSKLKRAEVGACDDQSPKMGRNTGDMRDHSDIYTLWLFNIAMVLMAHRNRWFTY